MLSHNRAVDSQGNPNRTINRNTCLLNARSIDGHLKDSTRFVPINNALLATQLRILNLNCCSLRSDAKKASFLALVSEHNPDVICGTESHLDQSFYASEIFPDEYDVFRKDRALGGGGVFVCIKKQLQGLEEPSLNVQAELIWVKITPLNQSPIHICTFYHPPISDSPPIEQLHLSLANLLNQSKTLPNILLMGDFNSQVLLGIMVMVTLVHLLMVAI